MSHIAKKIALVKEVKGVILIRAPSTRGKTKDQIVMYVMVYEYPACSDVKELSTGRHNYEASGPESHKWPRISLAVY